MTIGKTVTAYKFRLWECVAGSAHIGNMVGSLVGVS